MSKRSAAISELQISETHLRATLWRFPPGSETGSHRHEAAYVVVPVKGGTLTVENRPGDSGSPYPIETGKSYTRPAGVEHNIANDSDEEIAFVEVELLASPPST
ncbi:cupin domain-containing protein [Chelativorans sp. AA-79]|uniref:cupin domain-containing protein n=1 Tax=Chelativorans sp. AA-79 TaxID=3028735 RepID=UPI0023F7DF6F|nr:cupin domain-containing protein [Chelativorans sp. AA-79]WEX09801.1 cupin domain-containing protein [Chelativorans sp. AA-79]